MGTTTPNRFWEDLAEDLKDPEFLRAYVVESVRIETIDRLVNELDNARQRIGLSKAELARAISAEPAVVRRLLSLSHRNPTIGTLVEVAAALGLRVTLEPLSAAEREQVTEPLRTGKSDGPERLARRAAEVRRPRRRTAAKSSPYLDGITIDTTRRSTSLPVPVTSGG